MPVVMIPIHFDRNYQELAALPSCQRSIVLRPFVTCDFMTGLPAMPGEHLPEKVTRTHIHVHTLMNVIVMEREASHFGDVRKTEIILCLVMLTFELVFCYVTIVLGGATVLLSVSSLCR